MGNLFTSEVDLAGVSVLRVSPKYHGVGLIATTFIPEGTILNSHDLRGGFINDADANLPDEYTELTLRRLLSHLHQMDRTTTRNSLEQLEGPGRFEVLRDIYPGEEMTKRYRVEKWICFLGAYYVLNQSLLQRIAKEFGYEYTFSKF